MEINGIGRPNRPTGLTKPLKEGNNTQFREVLQARIDQTAHTGSATGPDGHPALLAQSEKVLGLLDDFAQALADPQRSLKDMAPLVQRMEGEIRLLEPAPGAQGEQGRSFSGLAREIRVLANVTLIKFHRGDFV